VAGECSPWQLEQQLSVACVLRDATLKLAQCRYCLHFPALRRNWFSQLHHHHHHLYSSGNNIQSSDRELWTGQVGLLNQSTAGILINTTKYLEYVPDHFQSVLHSSLVRRLPIPPKNFTKATCNFLRYPVNRQKAEKTVHPTKVAEATAKMWPSYVLSYSLSCFWYDFVVGCTTYVSRIKIFEWRRLRHIAQGTCGLMEWSGLF